MDYSPHTAEDRKTMMDAVGIASIEDLFGDIPERWRLSRPLDLPPALSEQETFTHLKALSERNRLPDITLTGAGAYRHYIPAVVGHLSQRSEFSTAYTPYQAEISQGILQAVYEYQTMIARLTGMQVANASMYDGATATAEAAVLSARTLGRTGVVVARSVHPAYRQVLRTYAWANGLSVEEAPFTGDGRLDLEALAAAVRESTAAVIVQSPNYFGVVEDLAAVAPLVHAAGAYLIHCFTEATSLGLLKPAGGLGADLCVGEGQAFGNPVSYGGPYLGIFAATDTFLRKIPGRLAGATVDRDGRRAFVLTLQTREQHIRREKATSNICSNEALCALAAAVYLVCLGKNLKPLAELNVAKAGYLRRRLLDLPGWAPAFSGPVYNEFVLRCPDPEGANARWAAAGISGGVNLAGDYPELPGALLLCATELLTRADLDRAVDVLRP
ncbi:MAG: aminomethyl-transferring glycine dehydrogenase subunit GcvPA [Syntrophales bacterium]|nr:aminomethyl-transferring glycine dehydrogenase subunit GcvPA [Syntrophales bacterium]MDD4338522.1 aminomethyl-transferring glycine dehydrogenase subunit GcvPA [Syntrophales bacterium]HOG06552.1 aminomethyl-transferring glycine dehydrogenase subunit GcvPA [Syntrophales bacterium]HOS78476.1 aminomethyl-transferring glycine dehydrogenase subunit GcvPA [Syntrophales bacterium]HPB69745.1 aminomethyl-transferring glycine dehydrogenase subunit GcvPA [Syntrophales bacterium]